MVVIYHSSSFIITITSLEKVMTKHLQLANTTKINYSRVKMFTSWILRNMDEKQRKQVCWDRELQVKMNQSPPSTSPNSD